MILVINFMIVNFTLILIINVLPMKYLTQLKINQ